MFAKPQSEHRWLEKLVGEWVAESECQMGPDQPPSKTTRQMSCRSLGGLWIIAESRGQSLDGDSWLSIMTLGYDLDKKRYTALSWLLS